jgi:hypothetical protein
MNITLCIEYGLLSLPSRGINKLRLNELFELNSFKLSIFNINMSNYEQLPVRALYELFMSLNKSNRAYFI